MGVDLRLATSDALGSGRNLVFNAWGLKSDNEGFSDEGTAGNDAAFGFAAAFPNDRFDAQVQWREIQENFDPALGFVQRSNVRMFRVGASFNPRPKNQWLGIQQMYHDIFFTEFTRLDDGLVESRDVYVTLVDWHFQSGDSLHSLFDVNPTYERLFEPFEISPGVVLPPGEYEFTPLRVFFSSAQKRRLQGSLGISFGSFWSGSAESVNVGVRYSAPPRLTISLNTNQTFARAATGRLCRQDPQGADQLCGLTPLVVLESDSVRQPLGQPRFSRPGALDPRAGERPVLHLRPGLGAGARRAWRRLPAAGLEVGREGAVHPSSVTASGTGSTTGPSSGGSS